MNREYSGKTNNMEKGYLLFLIGFISIFIPNFFSLTLVGNLLPQIVFTLLGYFAIFIFAVKIIFFDSFKVNEFIIYFIIFFLLLGSFLATQNLEFMELFLTMLAARGINRHKIIKLTFFLGLGSLLFTMLLSRMGIILDLTYERDLVIRHSFGTSYPTILGSMVFLLILQYSYIREKIRIWDILGISVVTFFLYKTTDNRLVFYLLVVYILYLILTMFVKIDGFFSSTWMKVILTVFCTGLPIYFIYFCQHYVSSSQLYISVDKLLTNRIYLSWKGLQDYPIKLFGQNILQYGFGGRQELPVGFEYFYLDSLPVSLLLLQGLLIYILYILYIFSNVRKTLFGNNFKLFVIMFAIILYDIADNKSVKLSLNPFMVTSFSLLFDLCEEGEYEINKKLPL
ncbi:hypothetical protein OZX60_00495 [Streptococcaceae bacterium ESL0687]|nr:hypothetical protein OZX60_00495 [Streptococcaceae bacterium ESL0687]